MLPDANKKSFVKKNAEQSQNNNSKKDLKMKFYQNLQLQTL